MMETKKTFTEPECSVERFDIEDIVATSIVRDGWDTNNYAFNNDSE